MALSVALIRYHGPRFSDRQSFGIWSGAKSVYSHDKHVRGGIRDVMSSARTVEEAGSKLCTSRDVAARRQSRRAFRRDPPKVADVAWASRVTYP